MPVLLWIFLLGVGATVSSNADAVELTFEKHVRPILKAQCFHCHGEEAERSGGLDVRLVHLMQSGGESGAAITPGRADESLLWQRVDANEMPEGPKKLTQEQKAVIKQWIDQGARTARPEPDNPEDARFSYEELQHWAYQPVRRPSMPSPSGYDLSTAVDGFIAAQLSENGLPFSNRASRHTLIRRLYFDLLGLPPTVDQVSAFVNDESPDAYQLLVDRLLSSPQFGVRWGRHWLDVAGFAETNGGEGADTLRPHAWRYRDYVIDAFNQSKPIDAFYTEQLAGDELIQDGLDLENEMHQELLTATGFLNMAPDATQSENTLANRNMAAADALKVVSSAMLGISVGCAQCHDHKYDPIGIQDYYRFRAVFDPVFPLQDWQLPNARLVDFTSEEVRAQADQIEARAKQLEDDLNGRKNSLAKKIQARKLADVPEAVRDATRTAVLAEPEKRTDQQKELLDLYPMVKPVGHIIGLLVEYDAPSYRKFEKESAKIAELRASKPPLRLVSATRERPGVVPKSTVFFRGNPESPGEEVEPAELMVLSRDRANAQLTANDSSTPTTGRRLAYARQLTDGTHPLTARVFVNRIWAHHMGRGIVSTPSDFGISGEMPSHPELLDWLADDFVQHGWDQKRLHRMILLSTTYQQVSTRTKAQDAIDPENRLLGRMSIRRLEAEAIRDSILAVVGQLSDEVGGASVPVTENEEGKVVIGRRKVRDGLKAGVDDTNADEFRRSAFIQVQRRLPLNMLATFDQPVMNPNCEIRRSSTVATQALWFLNDSMLIDCSERLAKLLCEAGYDATQSRCESSSAVDNLFVRLFAQPPSAEERAACIEFLSTQERQFEQGATRDASDYTRNPKVSALATLCQTLLASNRFLHVD